MKYINLDDPKSWPEIPPEFVCPICGDRLGIEAIDEWETETGRVTEIGLHIGCQSEPPDEHETHAPWFDVHYRTPYIDWTPVEARVYRWLDDHYRVSQKNRNRFKKLVEIMKRSRSANKGADNASVE